MQSSPLAKSAFDILIVAAICFGWFIYASLRAVAAGFPHTELTNAGLWGLVLAELVMAMFAVSYLRWRGIDIRQLLPRPTVIDSWSGIGLLLVTWMVAGLMVLAAKSFSNATQPVQQIIEGARISFVPLLCMSLVNGLYEEVFLVAYLQRALECSGPVFAVGASVLVRLLYHLYQGPLGAVSIFAVGIVFSAYYLYFRRLWPLVLAHISADFVSLGWTQ